jgi:cell division protein FtsZ
MTLLEAFHVTDSVLGQGVQGISDLITMPGLINVDFADVRTIMTNAGSSLMGIGTGVGENRAATAARTAIASPLLETTIEGAKGVLFNIIGGNDLTMSEVDEAAKLISGAVDPDANIIFGATIDEKLVDQIKITVIATGFDETKRRLRELSGRPATTDSRYAIPRQNPYGQPIRQPQPPSQSVMDEPPPQPKQTYMPPQQDDVPPEEDEFDIPAFLRQRS